MKGIELAKKYYEECGRPMLEKEFGDILPYLAAGFAGSGSERYGYDDGISQDHDFEPGFCIFLPGEDIIDTRTEFKLQRAYDKLPREFLGFKKNTVSPVGGSRNGVIRTADFYAQKTGSPTGELTLKEWITIPDSFLAEATNGEVFFDGYGEFTGIRKRLKDMPEDARRKKLAGALIVMAQSGQYNYRRCIAHGEREAAQLALNTFTESAAKAFFLLEKRHMPFYKWAFRAMRESGGEEYAALLAALISGDIYDKKTQDKKSDAVEAVAGYIINKLKEQALTEAVCGELEKHAYSVNDGIKDGEIRNANIFLAV